MARGKKTGGRSRGTPNKTTASVKQAFSDAFEKRGGVGALLVWANENPTEFYKLCGRLIPAEVQGELEHSGELVVRVVREAGGGSARGA